MSVGLRLLEFVPFGWVSEHFRLPFAHFAIVTDTDDVVGVLVETNHRQAVDWVLVAILGQTRLLDWSGNIL